MTLLDELCMAIEEGHPNDTVQLVTKLLEEGIEPVCIVEEAIVPTMQKIGENYNRGELDIPHILTAARSVQKGFETIRELRKDYQEQERGTIILGTVEGDLHDVGKNLVAMMLRGVGFRVIDLGVDVSEQQFLRAIKEHADVSIVCVSSLLSTSLPDMKRVVKGLRKKDPKRRYKIMVGGGAVTRELAASIGADGYTENCVEAVEMAKQFME